VVMFILCVVVLSRKRDRGDPVPRFLLFTICLQFALCSAHIGVAFGAGIHAFLAPIQNSVTLTVTKWDSPLGIYTALQQQFYGWNVRLSFEFIRRLFDHFPEPGRGPRSYMAPLRSIRQQLANHYPSSASGLCGRRMHAVRRTGHVHQSSENHCAAEGNKGR
ncbi:unnamed protein product, partial [Mycena citricolor]